MRIFKTDARSFLNGTTDRYGPVVLRMLDSMTRLSVISNVRLDNFVHTAASIQTAVASGRLEFVSVAISLAATA